MRGRPSSVRDMREKPPAPQPPTESTTRRAGFQSRNCGMRSRCVIWCRSKRPFSLMRPNARFIWVSFCTSSRVTSGKPSLTA